MFFNHRNNIIWYILKFLCNMRICTATFHNTHANKHPCIHSFVSYRKWYHNRISGLCTILYQYFSSLIINKTFQNRCWCTCYSDSNAQHSKTKEVLQKAKDSIMGPVELMSSNCVVTWITAINIHSWNKVVDQWLVTKYLSMTHF